LSKKEQKRLKRETEKKKAESEARRKAIPELTHAIEELVSGRKKSEELEGIIAEAKTLARQWKDPHSAKHPKDRLPLFDGTTPNRTFLLVGLVVALREDHRLLARIRRYFPGELEKLKSAYADIEAQFLAWLESSRPERGRKRKYEWKRRRWRRGDKGEMEQQFGRYTSALSTSPALSPLLSHRDDCLDEIFYGGGVNMLRLEELFGIGRHRLAELVDREDKKRGKYGHRAVGEIMNALLKEHRKKQKQSTPGAPRKPWLNNDADLRTRVLCGIERRITSIGTELLKIDRDKAFQWWKEIAEPFLSIVRRYRGG
jgi:hypothetical protein